MHLKFLTSLVLFVSFTACATGETKDCVDCSKKTVSAEVQPDKRPVVELNRAVEKPMAMATQGPLVIVKDVGRAPAVEPMTKENYQEHFCDKFAQIEGNFVGSTIREMEATPYPVDNYFKAPACQPEGYSNVVKSPIAHIIADDPSKRVTFLDSIWLYYSKKRKDPSKFVDMVNAKNTEGETLLDYLESMTKRGKYPSAGSQASVAKIIEVACSHGAVYSAYSEKKCP